MAKEENTANLVRKFADGKCSREEALLVIKWFKEQDYHNDLYPALAKLWYTHAKTVKESMETADLGPTLDRLHHRINIDREEEESGLRKRERFIRLLSRVAALFFLPLLITSILYISERIGHSDQKELYTQINSMKGSQLRTELPDGTVVWLNSGSMLRYPLSFTKRNRHVILSGEAFFDVPHERSSPFVVKTEALNIRVLGTQFNVMAYPDEDNVATTLEKGLLSVEKPHEGRNPSRICFLNSGERMVFEKESGTVNKFKTETDKYTSWKEGKLIFRNDPLTMVIKLLERWYNVNIEISGDINLCDTPYTMTIEDETITQVLEYLSVASPILWEMIPAQKREDEKVSKARYIISSKNSLQ